MKKQKTSPLLTHWPVPISFGELFKTEDNSLSQIKNEKRNLLTRVIDVFDSFATLLTASPEGHQKFT